MHGVCCYDSIHVCKLTALYTTNAFSAKRKMSASACTRSMAGLLYSAIKLVVRIRDAPNGVLHIAINKLFKAKPVSCSHNYCASGSSS